MARWMLYLSEFDIKLIHIPGKKNIQADALSRRPDLCPEGTDNENIIVLPEHLFVKQKRWPDWGLNPGPSRHIPDALTTEISGLTN